MLPLTSNRGDFYQLRGASEPWAPAIREICRRHAISSDGLERLSEGTNIIFSAGPVVIKLYPAYWSMLAEREAKVAEQVHGKLGVATPEVLARGELEGWPYLVTTRLTGTSLRQVWSELTPENQGRIAAAVGELMARLHSIAPDGLAPLTVDWPALIDERIAACVERRREQGLDEAWLRQIPAFLAEAAPLYPTGFTPVIVTGDMHQWHLLLSRRRDEWCLSGYFDFDDAMLGFREYDLAVPGAFMMAHRPDLFRAFVLAYGYPETALDEHLSRRLMAYTLLHRYRDLDWLLGEFVRDASCATLEQLTSACFGFDTAR